MLFLAVIKSGQSDNLYTYKNIRTINNIINMKSWQWDSDITDNISKEIVFIDGDLEMLADILDFPLKVTKKNMHKKSSAMYIALQCKCSKTVTKIVELLSMQTKKNINTVLIKINILVLKIISILFDFLHTLPNVQSHENSFLITLLSLNIHLNNLIENSNLQTNKYNFNNMNIHMNFQLINLIERFIISNCSIQDINEVETDKPSINESLNLKGKLQQLISYFDELLNNTGLSTFYFLKYNINNNIFNTKSSKDKDLNYNIIFHVLTQLNPILHFHEEINHNNFPKTIKNIYYVQRSVFDIILSTIYNKTLTFLTDVDANLYLFKDNIKDKRLQQNYQWFLIQSKTMQFPKNFINHIELMLRMIDDVLLFNTIPNSRFIQYEIKKKLYNISRRKNDSPVMSSGVHIKSLDGFIESLLSITNMNYFNQIFNVLHIELDNSYSLVVKHTQALNIIQYITKIDTNTALCTTAIENLYQYCFDMEVIANTEINRKNVQESTKVEQELRNHLTTVLGFLDGLAITDGTTDNNNTKSLILYATEFARFNVKHYPTFGNILEKVKRTVYHIMNLFDKYQMYNCSKPKYRYSEYKKYIANNYANKRFQSIQLSSKKRESRFSFGRITNKTIPNQNVETVMSSLKTVIEDLNHYQPRLNIFWKGDFHFMHFVLSDINQNAYHLHSYLKYVNLVMQWIVLVLFYTTIEILDCSVGKNNILVKMFDKYRKLASRRINYGFSTIKTFSEINSLNSKDPLDFIALGILLEKSIESICDVNVTETVSSCKLTDMMIGITNLSNIVEKIGEFYSKFLSEQCLTIY